MIRVVILTLALAAVPFIVYGLYELVRRGPDGMGPRRPSQWERDSVVRLGFAGLALAIVGIVTILATSGGSEQGIYVPARVENGKLIPGEFINPNESPERRGTVE